MHVVQWCSPIQVVYLNPASQFVGCSDYPYVQASDFRQMVKTTIKCFQKFFVYVGE